MAKVLLVEDEEDMSDAIKDWLVRYSHSVEVVGDGETALHHLKINKYDLIILDLMLPRLDGIEVCKRYRARGGDAHILMLTAKSALEDKEQGLSSGADDYLCKPFELRELMARVSALLKRPAARIPDSFENEKLTVDFRTGRVKIEGEEINLTPREFDLLMFLIRHQGESYSAQALLERVWPSTAVSMTESVRTCIKTLRKKLGDSLTIRHTPGFGYSITMPD